MIVVTEPMKAETQGTACPIENVRWTILDNDIVRQYSAVYGPDGRLWVGNPVPEEGHLLRILSGERAGLVIKSGYEEATEKVAPVGGMTEMKNAPESVVQLAEELGMYRDQPETDYVFPPVTVREDQTSDITSTEGVRHEPTGDYIPLADCTPSRGAKAYIHWAEMPSVQNVQPAEGVTPEWRYNL